MIKHLTIIGICFLFINCASLPEFEREDQKYLTEQNIVEINGCYNNFADNSANYLHLTLSGRLTASKLKDSVFQVKIEVLNSKEIQFLFLRNQMEIGSKTVKYKLQNNGSLLLRDKNFRLHGIPWIFGDYEIRKYQIGLSKTGNLILNGVEKREGGHFVILWSPGINYKFSDIYEKM